MRKIAIFIGIVLSLGTSVALAWQFRVATNPTIIQSPSATPNIITVGTSSLVTFTVSIPESTLNQASVNLLRVNANGSSTVVATMIDTGQSGDQTAGDKVFSARVSLLEHETSSTDFFVSAAFRGSIKRSLSAPFTVVAVSATQRLFSANGISFQYPSDFTISTTTPRIGDMYELMNYMPSSTGGVGGSLACTILGSTDTKSSTQSLTAWISENSREDGTDSTIFINGVHGIRKTFVSAPTIEPAVMVFLDGVDRVHVFSTVGESCMSVMDQVLQTISF